MKNLLIVLGLLACMTWYAAAPAAAPATSATPVAPVASPVKASSKPRAAGMPASARQYYAMLWGVDQLSAKLVESGALVRFSYRVLDARKAAPLHDKASSPQMIDEKAGVALQVPTMEKVGPLRQSMRPENGKSYWMAFSNKGNYVKPGHRVSVVIGRIRVDGLVVQ
jgi:hypothetical protein